MGNEITVLITSTYEELHKKLINQNFKIIDKYKVVDTYMLNKNIKSKDNMDILKNSIIIREIKGIKKVLVYKYKKYDKDFNILEQKKTECNVLNIKESIKFMETINFKKIFTIIDNCIVYSNNKTEFIVQIVNDKYIFLELEDICRNLKKKIQLC